MLVHVAPRINRLKEYLRSAHSSKDIQLQRLMHRDKCTQQAALARLNAQMPLASKLEYSDHVLDNSGSLTELEEQVNALVARFRRDAGWSWVISWLLPPVGLIMGLWRLSWRSVGRRRRRGRREPVPDEGAIRLEEVEE
jgi:dephospho-CoA kinase